MSAQAKREGIQLFPEAIEAAAKLKNGDSLVRYFQDHRPVGGFLTALLSNDLVGAFGAADLTNREQMYEYAAWLYNYAPARAYQAWGSREAVRAWAPGSG